LTGGGTGVPVAGVATGVPVAVGLFTGVDLVWPALMAPDGANAAYAIPATANSPIKISGIFNV
jgi:hypothetical protein